MPLPGIRALYCGDTSLTTAAAYLAGILHHMQWQIDYYPSDLRLSLNHKELLSYDVFIISDYPSQRVPHDVQKHIIEVVESGASFLMIGGWESFAGLSGGWGQTPLGEWLPVYVSDGDDRCHNYRPALLQPVALLVNHPILKDLPWLDDPPCIAGWNHLQHRDGQCLLRIEQYRVRWAGASLWADRQQSDLGLVVAQRGQGIAAVYASDVAPHWVGGFVDWGNQRCRLQAPHSEVVEVGNWYLQFWTQFLNWLIRGRFRSSASR